nr:hypothetical protein Iba_chr08cCG12100 [Ipomoea batatas]
MAISTAARPVTLMTRSTHGRTVFSTKILQHDRLPRSRTPAKLHPISPLAVFTWQSMRNFIICRESRRISDLFISLYFRRLQESEWSFPFQKAPPPLSTT